MAQLKDSLGFIPRVVNDNMYKGIDRGYFPKWEGWKLVDARVSVPDTCIKDFYNMFFWAKLKGDSIKCQHIANLLFIFAIMAGKKKAVSKIQRVLCLPITGMLDASCVEAINEFDEDYVFLSFYAEVIEFLHSMGQASRISDVINVYYNWYTRE